MKKYMINWRRMLARGLAVCTLACMAGTVACAETVQGDLTDRFGDIPTVEYNGIEYRVRNRLTTVLVMGAADETAEETAGERRAEFVALLVVDDDAKTITPIQIDSLALAQSGETEMTMREIFGLGEDDEGGCLQLLSTVNAMLPLESVQHYLSLDSDALTAYDPGDTDGLTAAEIFKSRLKILKAQAETYSTDQLNDLFYELSDYIVTDMKSGAIMKIIDKADRYEIFSSIHVPGEYVMEDDAAVAFIPDEAALNEIVIDAFLEENPW